MLQKDYKKMKMQSCNNNIAKTLQKYFMVIFKNMDEKTIR